MLKRGEEQAPPLRGAPESRSTAVATLLGKEGTLEHQNGTRRHLLLVVKRRRPSAILGERVRGPLSMFIRHNEEGFVSRF